MGDFENKNILVTGATGLIASHMIDELMKNDGVRITAVSRTREKLQNLFQKYLSKDNFKIIAQDVAIPFTQLEEKFDYIFHAASPIDGSIIQSMPVSIIEPNILGTINCLDYLKKQQEKQSYKGRLVVFSSGTVYANAENHDIIVSEPQTSVAASLDSPFIPYYESKRMVETLAKAYYKQYDVDIVIARFSYVYGYSYFTPDIAFYEFIKKAVNGENITVNNPDIARRDNIYIDDAVSGILHVASSGISGEAYNISSNGELGNFVSADEMAKVMADIVNKDNEKSVEVQYLNGISEMRKPGISLDNSKLKSLGWNLNFSLYDGIKATIEQYR